jgi:hypothetical protein
MPYTFLFAFSARLSAPSSAAPPMASASLLKPVSPLAFSWPPVSVFSPSMPPVVCAFLPAVVSAVLALLSLVRVSTNELVFWRALSDFSCEWSQYHHQHFRVSGRRTLPWCKAPLSFSAACSPEAIVMRSDLLLSSFGDTTSKLSLRLTLRVFSSSLKV